MDSNDFQNKNHYRSQASVFLEDEGDNWLGRNRLSLNNTTSFFDTQIIKRTLAPFREEIHTICEIGSSHGAKLDDLCRFFSAAGSGLDPSTIAVQEGNRAFSGLSLTVGTAANLPYGDRSFDLVYFGFCLYLVDRHEILKAVAEADRVLKNGGFLAILDFDPKIRHKRDYHHKRGLFSYKTCYADFFTSGGHYYLVTKESFSPLTHNFAKDSNDRVSISILYKEPDAY